MLSAHFVVDGGNEQDHPSSSSIHMCLLRRSTSILNTQRPISNFFLSTQAQPISDPLTDRTEREREHKELDSGQ